MTAVAEQPVVRKRIQLTTFAPVAGLAAVLILAAITTPTFYSPEVLRLVLFQVGLIGIAALGQTLVLLTGGIDLSISGVAALTSVILAMTTGGNDELLPLGILFSVIAGIAVGALNSTLIVQRGVPPFVATFASFVLIQGVIIAWTRGAPSGSIPDALRWIGTGHVAGLPVVVIIFAVLAIIASLVLARTTAGRRLYAAGLNADATRMSGIRVGLIALGAYVLAALSGVIVGLVNSGFIGFVDSALVGDLDLNSVAAAVIGGIALTGGRGRIWQTVVGAVLLASLLTWLIQLGAGGGAQLVFSGLVILIAVLLQNGSGPLDLLRTTLNRIKKGKP